MVGISAPSVQSEELRDIGAEVTGDHSIWLERRTNIFQFKLYWAKTIPQFWKDEVVAARPETWHLQLIGGLPRCLSEFSARLSMYVFELPLDCEDWMLSGNTERQAAKCFDLV